MVLPGRQRLERLGWWIEMWVTERKQKVKGRQHLANADPVPGLGQQKHGHLAHFPGDSCAYATFSTVGGVGPREQSEASLMTWMPLGPTPGPLSKLWCEEDRDLVIGLLEPCQAWEPPANVIFFNV